MTQHLAAKQLYIAVEGIDGSGKTTAIKFMEHLIKQKGKTCLTIREPGTTGLGEKIRDIIKSLQTLNYKPSDYFPARHCILKPAELEKYTELDLFKADMHQWFVEVCHNH